MQIVQVVPKDIEVIISMPLEELRKLEAALNESEFNLDQNDPRGKDLFDTVLKFHKMIQALLEEMTK